MRHALLPLLLILLLLFCGPAWAGINPIAKRATGTVACTAANYAALPAGATDGSLCTASDTGRVWRYVVSVATWLPPDITPVTMLANYTPAAGLPTQANPAWSSSGTEDAASDGTTLTITDDAINASRWFNFANAGIAANANLALLVRARVTAQGATAAGWRASMCMRPGSTTNSGCLALAAGAAGVDGATNVMIYSGENGASYNAILAGGPQTNSRKNGTLYSYLIVYRKDTLSYEMYALQMGEVLFRSSVLNAGTTYPAATSVEVGCSTAGTATMEITRMAVWAW